jgi:hypothetical protein
MEKLFKLNIIKIFTNRSLSVRFVLSLLFPSSKSLIIRVNNVIKNKLIVKEAMVGGIIFWKFNQDFGEVNLVVSMIYRFLNV